MTSSPLRIAGIVAVIAILAVGGFGAFYLFGRSTPDAVGLPGASSSAAPTTDATASAEPSDGAASPTASADGATTGSLDGTWIVDPSIGSFADFTSSFVGYRVQEELVGIGAATAVGRTPDVTGSLVVSGTRIDDVTIEADLTGLQSDSSMRDGQLGRQGIETDTYPAATFVLAEPIALAAVPADGETVSVTAVGDLTLHGVTQQVEIPLQAARSGDVVTVVGSLEIVFADYGIREPESMRVLSIEDRGTLELQLHFTRA